MKSLLVILLFASSVYAQGYNFVQFTVDSVNVKKNLIVMKTHRVKDDAIGYIGCNIKAVDCSPLTVGETYNSKLLPDNDPNAYRTDDKSIVGSIRVSVQEADHPENTASFVYFLVNKKILEDTPKEDVPTGKPVA